jgi:predicted membrane protein
MSRRSDEWGRRSSGDERRPQGGDGGSFPEYRRHGFGTAILGLGVLTLGLVMLLDNFGIIDGEALYGYWPVFLILIGISHLVRPEGSRRVAAGIIWIAIGTAVLLSNLGSIPFDIWDLWPVVLLIIGGSLILRPFRRGPSLGENVGFFEATAILGGSNRRLETENFQGGDATALLGGCKIDLRDCGSEGGPAEINTFSFWGGVEILVPEDWDVQVRGLAILGGYGDKTRGAGGEGGGRKVLIVRGLAIMGGVEVKN